MMYRPFGPKPLTEVVAPDLQQLIKDAIPEGLFVEYKSEWHATKVARAVASFANTHGGTLIVGMEANKLLPAKVVGVENRGDLEERVVQAVRSSIAPVPAFTPQVVPLKEDRACLLVEVLEGLEPPYLLMRTGQILVRTAVNSEPVPANDRETLDRLFARGRRGEAWAWDQVVRLTRLSQPLMLPVVNLSTSESRAAYVLTVPAVEDGLAVGARVFQKSFLDALEDHARKLAIYPYPAIERSHDGVAVQVEAEAINNSGVIRLSVETTGIALTNWERAKDGDAVGWLRALTRDALPLHASITEDLLGHRGNVALALGAVAADTTDPLVTIARRRVSLGDLVAGPFLESLDRDIERSLGYTVYEPEA